MATSLGRRILLIGGGGHCRSVIDSILSLNAYDDIGIIDYVDSQVLGVPVIGNDNDIPRLKDEGWTDAFITVGSIGNTTLRRELFEMVMGIGLNTPSVIDPYAIVARGTNICKGVYIGKRAVINTGSRIGTGAIINTGSIIEHDCKVDEFSHISPGVTLCGQVYVGEDSHVGAGSVVRQQIKIGDNVLIGAGSVVVKDIPNGVKAYGNPCRVVS